MTTRHAIGTTRYNTANNAVEVHLGDEYWSPVSPSTSTWAYNSAVPTPLPRRVGGARRSDLPHAIDTINALMQDMSVDQLDDLVDAALEELRLRKRGKYPEEGGSDEED